MGETESIGPEVTVGPPFLFFFVFLVYFETGIAVVGPVLLVFTTLQELGTGVFRRYE